jgi:hypothetical protein
LCTITSNYFSHSGENLGKIKESHPKDLRINNNTELISQLLNNILSFLFLVCCNRYNEWIDECERVNNPEEEVDRRKKQKLCL